MWGINRLVEEFGRERGGLSVLRKLLKELRYGS
jgi:hypothetical protein